MNTSNTEELDLVRSHTKDTDAEDRDAEGSDDDHTAIDHHFGMINEKLGVIMSAEFLRRAPSPCDRILHPNTIKAHRDHIALREGSCASAGANKT